MILQEVRGWRMILGKFWEDLRKISGPEDDFRGILRKFSAQKFSENLPKIILRPKNFTKIILKSSSGLKIS